MKICVLMPVWDANLEWLKLAIESITYQDHPNFQLIIVDDNNPKGVLTDYIYGLTQRDCCVNIVRTPENKGIAAALDYGLQHCHGDLVVRMDDDDIADPQLLRKHDEYFMAHPQRDICGVQIRLFSHTRQWVSSHPLTITRKLAYQRPGHWFINHPGSAYRTKAIRAVKGYGNTPADCAEDYALWVKFLLNGYTIYNREDVLMDYRVQPKSFSHVQNRHSANWHGFLETQKSWLYEK